MCQICSGQRLFKYLQNYNILYTSHSNQMKSTSLFFHDMDSNKVEHLSFQKPPRFFQNKLSSTNPKCAFAFVSSRNSCFDDCR